MGDLNGRVILITGGTGSFGKKVTAKLLKEGEVSQSVILSRDEKAATCASNSIIPHYSLK